MANEKTEFIHVEKIRYWCNKILPLAYDDSLSYYEVLARVQEKINELIHAHNELPDYIKEAVIEYAHSEEFNDYIKTIFANLVVNVKYPPAGLKAAVGDGVTNDSDAFQNVLDYCNANQRIMFIPDGKYVITRKLYMSYPVIGASDDTVYILAPKNTVVFSNETYETVTTTTPTTGEVVKTETKITGRSQIAKLKNVHCNPANIDFDADYIEIIRVSANSVKLVSHQTSECSHLGCAHLETDGVGHNFENLVFSGTADPDIETNPLSFITHCGNLSVRATIAGSGRVGCLFDDKAVYPISSTFIGDCAPVNQKFYDEFNAPCATYLSRQGDWTIVRGQNHYQVTITKIADAYEIMASHVTLKGNPDLYLKAEDETLIQYHGPGSITRPTETLIETAKNINRTAKTSITDTAPTVNINGSSKVSTTSGASNVTVNTSGVKATSGSNSSIEANANGVKAAYGSDTSVEVNASGAFVKDGDSAVEVKTDEGATLRDGSNVFVKVAGEQGVFIEGDNKPIDIHGNEVNATADTVAVTGPTEVNVASKNLKLHDSNEANNWGITGTTGLSGDGAINIRTNTASILAGGKRIVAKPVSEAAVKAGIDLTAGKSIIYNPSFQVPAKFNDYFNYVSAPDATGSNTSKLLFAGDKLAELLPGSGEEGGIIDVTKAGDNSLTPNSTEASVLTANVTKLNNLAKMNKVLFFPAGTYSFNSSTSVTFPFRAYSYEEAILSNLNVTFNTQIINVPNTIVLRGITLDRCNFSNLKIDIAYCTLNYHSLQSMTLSKCSGSISHCKALNPDTFETKIVVNGCDSLTVNNCEAYSIGVHGSNNCVINNNKVSFVMVASTTPTTGEFKVNNNCIVANNIISGGVPDDSYPYFLSIQGLHVLVQNNIVTNTFQFTDETHGVMSMSGCQNCIVIGNTFEGETSGVPFPFHFETCDNTSLFTMNIIRFSDFSWPTTPPTTYPVIQNNGPSWTQEWNPS